MRRQAPTTDVPHILPGPHFRSNLPGVEIEILRGRARQLFRKVSARVFLIGTAADCDMVLGDSQFPEVYAYLFLSDQGVVLRYLGAGPVLTVNSRLVQSAAVFDGDMLRMANYEFAIHIDWDDRPERKKRRDSRANHALQTEPEALAQVEELLCDVRNAVLADKADATDGPHGMPGKSRRSGPLFSKRSGRASA